jgi:hypothetical protein
MTSEANKERPVQRDGKRVASATYRSWQMMKNRCLNPNADDYARYGGRGITVCRRWMQYDNFVADMGARPTGLTLERKNSNGNYHKQNCRWATRAEQSRNRNYCRLTHTQAERMRSLYTQGCTQAELARRFQCSQALASRVVRGLVW